MAEEPRRGSYAIMYVCMYVCMYVFVSSFTVVHLDPVVRRPISANPGLNFNPGLFFFS